MNMIWWVRENLLNSTISFVRCGEPWKNEQGWRRWGEIMKITRIPNERARGRWQGRNMLNWMQRLNLCCWVGQGSYRTVFAVLGSNTIGKFHPHTTILSSKFLSSYFVTVEWTLVPSEFFSVKLLSFSPNSIASISNDRVYDVCLTNVGPSPLNGYHTSHSVTETKHHNTSLPSRD